MISVDTTCELFNSSKQTCLASHLDQTSEVIIHQQVRGLMLGPLAEKSLLARSDNAVHKREGRQFLSVEVCLHLRGKQAQSLNSMTEGGAK